MLFPILILSSNGFSILALRQASFVKLRTGRANGLKNELLTRFFRQVQDETKSTKEGKTFARFRPTFSSGFLCSS
jgi:hypothetical protein